MTALPPLVAILRGVLPDDVEAIGERLVDAGFGGIEVPLNSPEPFRSISLLARRFGDHVLVGAGTVLTRDEVSLVNEAGGRLVVSPNMEPDVIRFAKTLGLVSLPGIFTPTEAFGALRAGADGLKFFPASLHGPHGIKAIRAVLPSDTSIYAVGGADAANVGEWLEAGANGFGIGSAVFKPGWSADQVGKAARTFAEAYRQAA